MKKDDKKQVRSVFTTVGATLIGVAILFVSILMLPLSSVAEVMTFVVGLLLVIICAIIAIEGKKGTLREVIYSLTFWR